MVSIAVLASGTGSNLQAIIDFTAQAGERRSGSIALVASNRSAAGALERGRAAGIPSEVFNASDDGTALLDLLQRHSIDLVVLAGYLKRLPPKVISAFRSRIINIHPGLLPQFGGAGMYGSRVHAAVLEAGSPSTGVTVHFVDEEFDHGPTIAQWRIPVRDDDTAETLAARVLEIEHLVYPAIVEMVASLNDKHFFADY